MNTSQTPQLHKHSVKQRKFSILDLIKAKKLMDKQPVQKTEYYQIHSIETWKLMRDNTNLCFPKWSDDELNNFNKETGLIGNKCGIDCYVYVP